MMLAIEMLYEANRKTCCLDSCVRLPCSKETKEYHAAAEIASIQPKIDHVVSDCPNKPSATNIRKNLFELFITITAVGVKSEFKRNPETDNKYPRSEDDNTINFAYRLRSISSGKCETSFCSTQKATNQGTDKRLL